MGCSEKNDIMIYCIPVCCTQLKAVQMTCSGNQTMPPLNEKSHLAKTYLLFSFELELRDITSDGSL